MAIHGVYYASAPALCLANEFVLSLRTAQPLMATSTVAQAMMRAVKPMVTVKVNMASSS